MSYRIDELMERAEQADTGEEKEAAQIIRWSLAVRTEQPGR